MTTKFTDYEAAVDEAHFIQQELNETALITHDAEGNLFVITRTQYENSERRTDTVLEICQALGGKPARWVLASGRTEASHTSVSSVK